VKSIRETDVRAALGNLRELLQAEVGISAPVLKALVGDVVVEARKVEGKARPEMVARFTINAIPAMALLARGNAGKSDDPTVTTWEFLHGDRWTMPSQEGFSGVDVTVPLRKPPKYEVMLPQIVEMTEAGSGVDLISRALGIGAEVVRDALHLHRTGKRPPGRVDGRRSRGPQADPPAVQVDRGSAAGQAKATQLIRPISGELPSLGRRTVIELQLVHLAKPANVKFPDRAVLDQREHRLIYGFSQVAAPGQDDSIVLVLKQRADESDRAARILGHGVG
jgi:hypothetical protein